MSAPNSFRMFKARGQPGCWYGYAEIDGVTYKIDAKHVGEGIGKHFEGTIKRHLKADQQDLLTVIAREARRNGIPEPAASRPPLVPEAARQSLSQQAKDIFDDEIPF